MAEIVEKRRHSYSYLILNSSYSLTIYTDILPSVANKYTICNNLDSESNFELIHQIHIQQ